jgi:hypothetical protein
MCNLLKINFFFVKFEIKLKSNSKWPPTRLQISVSVSRFVNVSNRGYNLSKKGPRFALAQTIPVNYVVEELAAWAIFQHHKDLCVSFDNLRSVKR